MQDTLTSPVIDIAFFSQVLVFTEKHPNSLTRLWSTPTRNRLVGGAKESGHVQDDTHVCHAVDLVFDTAADLRDAAQTAVSMGFQGVEVDLTNMHLHLDAKPRLWQVVHHGPNQETPLTDWLKQVV